jgi:HTH-type transcriptional regulator, glycine betaine synthesis regulator
MHKELAGPSMAVGKKGGERTLSPLEQGVIDYFVHLFRIFNLPKSVGEIYGILFASSEPLNMDDIIQRLQMSKGAVSQGLKLLRSYGALDLVYLAGDRRDHFKVMLGMRKLATGFLKEQLVPHMEGAALRLQYLEACADSKLPEEMKVVAERIDALKSWQSKGKNLLPELLKFLNG